MYRVLTSSNRAIAQRVVRSTLTFTRGASGDPEAGSVSGQDAFGKKEKAEETRWARRFEAEQAEKYRAKANQSTQGGGQQTGNTQAYGQQQSGGQGSAGSVEEQIAELEAEKRRIKQQISDLKRQQH